MAETSRIRNTSTTPAGHQVISYTDADWRTLLKPIAGDGVFAGWRNSLAITSSAGTVTVDTGGAALAGRLYDNSTPVSKSVGTPTTATRIDRLVVRDDVAANTTTVVLKTGTEGGAAPGLTTDEGTVYEISLAEVEINTAGAITVRDTRTFVPERAGHTLSDTVAPTSNKGAITVLLNGIVTRIRSITGGGSWRDAPVRNLAQLYTEKVAKAGDTLSGDLNMDNGSTDAPGVKSIDPVNNTWGMFDLNAERPRIAASYRGAAPVVALEADLVNSLVRIFGQPAARIADNQYSATNGTNVYIRDTDPGTVAVGSIWIKTA